MRHACLLALALGTSFVQTTAADPVDYLRDIKPILQERCYACHGALKQKGKLRLDTAALIRQGGRHGAAIEPGRAAESLLIERVTAGEENRRMPPEGQPLSERQIALLTAWIDQGAPAPADEKPEEDPSRHWAFVKPVRPPVPRVADAANNPVDAFLAAARARHGLTANPPADRPTLLRRVYFDLIGLPPTRDELHAFLADPAPDAYERVVDRLLASPRYGERWARHWMDIWRYSDWYGRRSVPDVMNSYPMIWRWRDWIVRSLNEDRGYDQMVREMLAGDELAPEDDGALAATGFLVRNWFKWNYNQWMRDNVEHTGKAFLGLTLNCCHCHDHKYDPITQEEYFRFRAFFEPLELRHDRVPGEPDPGPFRKYVYTESYGPITSGRIRVFDEKPDAPTYFYTGGDERNRVANRPPVPPGVPAALGGDQLRIEPVNLPPTAWYPGLQPFIQEEEIAKRQAAVTAAEKVLALAGANLATAELRAAEAAQETSASIPPPAARDILARRQEAVADARFELQLAEARHALAQSDAKWVQARIAADRIVYSSAAGAADSVCRAASRAERQYQLDAALLAQLQAEQALATARRDAATPPAQLEKLQKQAADAAAKVATCRQALSEDGTSYTPLTPIYPRTSSGRRSALARWITSPDNPLTARVAVNHLWGRHFGRPLVETTFNFGRSGQRPSHPELLDWLATELLRNGWRIKPLHRLIVTSAAYRMRSSAPVDHPNRAIDPDNRSLWHFPIQRLEAEVIRDSLLHVAGNLDGRLGGPEIPHEQGLTSRRRSLYFAHHGESKMEFLELFDAANPCEAYRRTTSILPQQALALTNSSLSQQQSQALARRLQTNDDGEFLRAAFEHILSRQPSTAEEQACRRFLGRQTSRQPAASGKHRENLILVLFNHNDFVTVR